MGWCQTSTFEVAFGWLRCRVWRGDASTRHLWVRRIPVLRGMVLWPQPPVWRLQPPSGVLRLSGRREGVANRSGTENITLPIQFVFSESRSSHSVWFLNQNFNWKFYEVSFQSWYCFYFLIFTRVLPAAFGKRGISAKVLESISKQVLIKALKTET